MAREKKGSTAATKKAKKKVVNLRFLECFMKELNLSVMDIANAVSLSKQGVYHWFNSDDASLSIVCRAIEAYGYRLTFALEPLHKEDNGVFVLVRDSDSSNVQRLDFLRSALKKNDCSMQQVAEKFDVGVSAVYHWFSVGDCYISYMYRMAALIDHRLLISIVPQDYVDGTTIVPQEKYLSQINPQLEEIKGLMDEFIKQADKNVQGNKAAGLRARGISIQIQAALLDFRKESVAMGKR